MLDAGWVMLNADDPQQGGAFGKSEFASDSLLVVD
jgi:hypothetical protein